MTFAQDIEDVAGAETIEAVVIGAFGWESSFDDAEAYGIEGRVIDAMLKGRPLPWSEARPLLDYEYNTGYGAPDCHAIVAYTATRVIAVWKYDGATGLFAIPRNPVESVPEQYGGG